MATKNFLTAERLRKLLRYDPETGYFTWLASTGKARIGNRAGTTNAYGYWRISIDGKEYRAARLAWLYITDTWPSHEIDHKDRNRLNNAWHNLRAATRKQNSENRGLHSNNKTGTRGVFWVTRQRHWRATIKHLDKTIYLGSFQNIDDAIIARRNAEKRLFMFLESEPS